MFMATMEIAAWEFVQKKREENKLLAKQLEREILIFFCIDCCNGFLFTFSSNLHDIGDSVKGCSEKWGRILINFIKHKMRL